MSPGRFPEKGLELKNFFLFVRMISSFKVEQEGSKLFVTAPDDKPVEATREPPAVQAKQDGKGVVIIGGGAGAAHAIESLREEGYEGRIRVVSAEK